MSEGAAQLLKVFAEHDQAADVYRLQQRELISRYLPGNEAMTQHYVQLLNEVVSKPAR